MADPNNRDPIMDPDVHPEAAVQMLFEQHPEEVVAVVEQIRAGAGEADADIGDDEDEDDVPAPQAGDDTSSISSDEDDREPAVVAGADIVHDQNQLAGWLAGQVESGLLPGLAVLIDKQINRVLTSQQLDMGDTTVVYIAMSYALASLDPTTISGESPAQWVYHIELPAAQGGQALAQDVFLDAGSIAAVPARASDVRIFMTRLLDAIGKSKVWLVSLAACYQVRALNVKLITNYFKQYSPVEITGAIILPLIRYSAGKLMKITTSAMLRDLIGDSTYVKYHTGFSATASIILMMGDAFGPARKDIFGNEVWRIVRRSKRDYWSKEANSLIPDRLVAVTAIWAKVNKVELGNWYQGNAALGRMSAVNRNVWTAFFERYKDVAESELKFKDAKKLDDVVKALPESIRFL